jgi:hypothetical protein
MGTLAGKGENKRESYVGTQPAQISLRIDVKAAMPSSL